MGQSPLQYSNALLGKLRRRAASGGLERALSGVTKEDLGEANLASFETLTPAEIEKEAFEAAKSLAPMLRAFLVANYGASGLKKRTGDLVRAVARVSIAVGKRGIRVTFPPGLTRRTIGRDGKPGKMDPRPEAVYVQGMSLQHGAVHVPKAEVTIAEGQGFTSRLSNLRGAAAGVTSVRTEVRSVLGRKAKATIKKAVLKGKRPRKSKLRDPRARLSSDVTKTRHGSIRSGNVVIVPPHPFFKLNPSQLAQLQSTFTARLQARLDRRLSRKAS